MAESFSFAPLLQVVDGSFHYAPEAMTLFDYRQELGPCLLLFALGLLCLLWIARQARTTSVSIQLQPQWFGDPLSVAQLSSQEWEGRAEKEPTFMYVMPLGPARASERERGSARGADAIAR